MAFLVGRRVLAVGCLVGALVLGTQAWSDAHGGGSGDASSGAQAAPLNPSRDVGARGYLTAETAWRDVPVDQLFPPTVQSRLASLDLGAQRTFVRVRVADPAPCSTALDPELLRVLSGYGCARVLRAAYLDSTGTLAGTAGIVVLDRLAGPGAPLDAADKDLASRGIAAALLPTQPGLWVRIVPGAPGGFSDAARLVGYGALGSAPPYLFLATAGLADGRVTSGSPLRATAAPESGAQGMARTLVDGVVQSVRQAMAATP